MRGNITFQTGWGGGGEGGGAAEVGRNLHHAGRNLEVEMIRVEVKEKAV